MTTWIPARCKRRATPEARSPPPRRRTRPGLFCCIERPRRRNFFWQILRSPCLLSQHMTEGVEQQENKQEEDGIEHGKRGQTPAWVDHNAQDLLSGLARVLQDVPGVQPHEAPDVNPEAA